MAYTYIIHINTLFLKNGHVTYYAHRAAYTHVGVGL